jgi:AcrR family transcriptional regulator
VQLPRHAVPLQTSPQANIFQPVAGDPPGESPELPDELARLPPGRHGLPPEFVEQNQRRRLIASLIQVVAERGYNGATITAIIQGASITSATFYKYFDDVEACYLAAFDQTAALLGERLAEAYGSRDEWPLKIGASLASLLDFFATSPQLGRLCLVEPFVAGPAISRRYQEASEKLVPYLRQGRELLGGDPDALPETTERGLLGSIASQVARKLPEPDELPALLPDLTQFALTPYLGPAEARRLAQTGT